MSSKIVPLKTIKNHIPFPSIFRVVQVHGCFDCLHIGHILHFKEAKKLGDILIVTVTHDKFVNKGKNRPIFSHKERAEMIAALECVDYVAINRAKDACYALTIIKPDIYCKGRDYIGIDCPEFRTAKEVGAKVIFTKSTKYSTTELIDRIRNEH